MYFKFHNWKFDVWHIYEVDLDEYEYDTTTNDVRFRANN